METKTCIGYSYDGYTIDPHELEWTDANFPKWAMDPTRPTVRCKTCDKFRRTKVPPTSVSGLEQPVKREARPKPKVADFAQLAERMQKTHAEEERDIVQQKTSHDYVLDPELETLWRTVVNNTLIGGRAPANIVFFGPSGSGKTHGAEHLAELVSLPFTKVDAASMTDPESWFGTREIIVEQGVSVTKYVPSAFAEAVQKPGVVFIDEMTRVDDEHRNVLLPLTDGTGRVTNPLTGEQVIRHPHCFIIMAGNRGLQFTGTSAVDPAFTTRALTVEFDYIDERKEIRAAMDETGCDADTATVFVKFANDTRAKAKAEPDFQPISTREVLAACALVAGGMTRDLAAKFAIINQASPEGMTASQRTELEGIWAGVRVTKAEVAAASADPDPSGWKCPTHGKVKVVPAGVSQRTGKPYKAFKACPENYCEETEDASKKKSPQLNAAGGVNQLTCTSCGNVAPPGRSSFCPKCGGVLQ